MPTRKNKHYFLIDPKNKVRIGTKARNARTHVVLSRTVADMLRGTQGMAVTCANVQCALRLNGDAFPHPALMAEFTDNRAYIVDKVSKRGEPISCVVYAHGEGSFQKLYDTTPKQRLTKMSGVEKSFILNPPPVHGAGRTTRGGPSGPSGTPHRTRIARQKPLGIGAMERARRAGIVIGKAKGSK